MVNECFNNPEEVLIIVSSFIHVELFDTSLFFGIYCTCTLYIEVTNVIFIYPLENDIEIKSECCMFSLISYCKCLPKTTLI